MKTPHPTIYRVLLGIACVAMTAASSPVMADDYPSRPVTINVGYGPGDNMDLIARLLASKAEKILGQPLIVVNKAGAAGAVALTSMVKEKADGYQIAAVLDTPLARLPALRKLSYKMDEFTPIMQFASGVSGVVVKSSAPWKTLPELISYAKANPGKISYTTTGAGTTMDVAFQFIGKQAGAELIHVPYPAAQQGLSAVHGGHVTVAVGSTQWVPAVRDGSLRLLAVISDKRMTSFPAVPTIREMGYDFVADTGSFLVAPVSTPAPILKKLADAFHAAMKDPDYVKLLKNLELEPKYRDGVESRKYLGEVEEKFAKSVVDLKIPTDFDAK